MDSRYARRRHVSSRSHRQSIASNSRPHRASIASHASNLLNPLNIPTRRQPTDDACVLDDAPHARCGIRLQSLSTSGLVAASELEEVEESCHYACTDCERSCGTSSQFPSAAQTRAPDGFDTVTIHFRPRLLLDQNERQ